MKDMGHDLSAYLSKFLFHFHYFSITWSLHLLVSSCYYVVIYSSFPTLHSLCWKHFFKEERGLLKSGTFFFFFASFLFYLKIKIGRGEEENLFSLKEHVKVCCYKYFKGNLQKKPEVFVSDKEKYQLGNNSALCLHSLKAKDFFFHIIL